MVSIVRWILGYLKFVIRGDFPEKFINLVAKSNISIWNIKKDGNKFLACAVVDEYKDLKKISRKTRTRIKILEKHGMPFVINKLKKRKGAVLGVIIFTLLLYIFSLYIWDVKVVGDGISDVQKIEQVASEFGVCRGNIKKDLDISYIEQNLMINVPELSWVSVNIIGSLVEISVKQRDLPPDIVPKSEPCNIKAKEDGQIIRLEVSEGTPVVKAGDAVLKGELLVSGVFEDKLGGAAFKHADGKVWACTKKHVNKEIDLNQKKYELTNESVTRKKIRIFGAELPLNLVPMPDYDYEKEIRNDDVFLFGQKLPISLYREIYTKENVYDVLISEEEAKEQSEEFLDKFEESELKDIKILDKKVEGHIDNNRYLLSCEYICEENIAYKNQIIVE